MLSAAGFLGFSIALVGLYGVVTYAVTARTREFGIMRAWARTAVTFDGSLERCPSTVVGGHRSRIAHRARRRSVSWPLADWRAGVRPGDIHSRARSMAVVVCWRP